MILKGDWRPYEFGTEDLWRPQPGFVTPATATRFIVRAPGLAIIRTHGNRIHRKGAGEEKPRAIHSLSPYYSLVLLLLLDGCKPKIESKNSSGLFIRKII